MANFVPIAIFKTKTKFVQLYFLQSTNRNAYLQCLGWTNEVVVFDTQTNTWSMPEMQVDLPHDHCSDLFLRSDGLVSTENERIGWGLEARLVFF